MTEIIQFYTPSRVVYRGRRELGIGVTAANCIVLDHPPVKADYENVLEYSFRREEMPRLQRMPSCGSGGYTNEDWALFCSRLYRGLLDGSTRHFAWVYCVDNVWLTGRMKVLPGDLDVKNFRLYLFFINKIPEGCVRHMDMVRDAVRIVLDVLKKPCDDVVPSHTLIRFKGGRVAQDEEEEQTLHPIVCLWWQLQASKHAEYDAIFQMYSDMDASIQWKTDLFFRQEK